MSSHKKHINYHRQDNVVLNELKNKLIEANNVLATAQAVDKSLSGRLERFETAFDAALDASNTSATNYADGLKAATSLAGNETASRGERTIAEKIEADSHLVFVQAYETALLTIEAAYAIVAVQTEKDVIVAKNQLKDLDREFISKIDQAVIDAEAAVEATTKALQEAMLAYTAANKAAESASSVAGTIKETLHVMAPGVTFPIRSVKELQPKGGLLGALYQLNEMLQDRTDLLRDVTHQAKVQLKRADLELAAAEASDQGAQAALKAGLIAVNRGPNKAAVALVREIAAMKTG